MPCFRGIKQVKILFCCCCCFCARHTEMFELLYHFLYYRLEDARPSVELGSTKVSLAPQSAILVHSPMLKAKTVALLKNYC